MIFCVTKMHLFVLNELNCTDLQCGVLSESITKGSSLRLLRKSVEICFSNGDTYQNSKF